MSPSHHNEKNSSKQIVPITYTGKAAVTFQGL